VRRRRICGRRRVCGWWARLLMLIVLLPGGSVLAQSPPAASESGPVHVVDLAHPSFAQHVDLSDGDLKTFDFVQVRIVQVINPQRIGVLFEVAFLADDGSHTRLGSFSLFPPDNPGQFIVATQHRVRSTGSIVVSLHTAQPIDASTPLAISISSVALTKSR
jgi:hypothetical protein